MLLRSVIGSALRRIRLEQGRTLRDVALAAAISTPYLSEIERGRKEPSSEVLATVLRVLGLSLVDLLDETRDETLRGAVVVDLTARAGGPGAGPARHRLADDPDHLAGTAPVALAA